MDGGADRMNQLEIENKQLRLQVKRLEIQIMEMTVATIQEKHPQAVSSAQALEAELRALLPKPEKEAGNAD